MLLFRSAMICVFALGGCGNAVQPAARATLAPEMRVKAANGTSFMACVSKDALDSAVRHAVLKERTKFEAMFADASCTIAPGDKDYKILSVSGDVVEFVNSNSEMADGMWTEIESLDPAP